MGNLTACDCSNPPKKNQYIGKGVRIRIPLKDKTERQKIALRKAEDYLHEAGVFFDTGVENDIRDWEFDWSLVGLFTICKNCKCDSRDSVKDFSKQKMREYVDDSDMKLKYKKRAEVGY